MGVDLKLLPLALDGDWPFPTNALCLDRERELWTHMRDHLAVQPLDVEFYDYRDEGLVRTKEDAYGCALTWAKSEDLHALLDAWLRRPLEPGEFRSGQWTRAACAYLEHLTLGTRVVLWWH